MSNKAPEKDPIRNLKKDACSLVEGRIRICLKKMLEVSERMVSKVKETWEFNGDEEISSCGETKLKVDTHVTNPESKGHSPAQGRAGETGEGVEMSCLLCKKKLGGDQCQGQFLACLMLGWGTYVMTTCKDCLKITTIITIAKKGAGVFTDSCRMPGRRMRVDRGWKVRVLR